MKASLILGPAFSTTYPEVVNLFQEKDIRGGYTTIYYYDDDQGNTIRVGECFWYTTLMTDRSKMERRLELTKDMFLSYVDGNREVQSITPAVIHGFYADIQHKYKSSTACSFMTKLKTFIQYGLDNGYLRINPFQAVKLVKEKPKIDFLTESEVEALRTTQIDNRSLSNVRDAFLLQIYSGLSFIDLEHLTREDIRTSETGVYYISKERVKTKVPYTSIILPEGVEVLKRHDFKVPVISNQKMNMFLKQVMLLCGIEHRLITHLGRKTYAHTLLNRGVRLETVARALGHSSSRTTARYYTELTPETTIKEVKEIFK